jgi:hypothetical protein
MPDPINETPETEETKYPDAMEMSDEDFEKLAEPEGAVTEPEESEEPPVETEEEEPKPETEQTEETATEKGPDANDKTAGETAELPKEEAETETDRSPDKTGPETDEKAETKTEQETPTVDFEAEYKRITAPFKANGSEMQVKNTEDAIRLMQMGANYHHKMAALKPSLKTLKLLEKNDLMDPEKINFLIDLHNKNPEAITKLIRDSQIDPLDINTKDESNYKPTQRNVSDTELALDSVLEEIRETPTYAKTLNILTEKWDDTSRNTIAAQPQIIAIINEHVADGTYDKVMNAVAYERSLGQLKGISDFDAYKQMGDALYAAGQLTANPPAEQPAPVQKPSIPKPTETPTPEEIARKNRKKAASPTKTTGTPALKTFDPLSLSDEEFEKFDPKHFQIKP